MEILLLSDGRPGHYHLAEGVVKAIGRTEPVNCHRLEIARRKIIPGRMLRGCLNSSWVTADQLLRLGYGLKSDDLPKADLVVSSGGETLMANILAARTLGSENIFCGSLRKVKPENFSLVITSYERFKDTPRHLVSLKPNPIDPDKLDRPEVVPQYGQNNPPKTAALLIGGNSGYFSYQREDWEQLLNFAEELSRVWGTKWLVSTSRRSDDQLGDAVSERAENKDVYLDFLDYRTAGPGTLPLLFSKSDIIVCTEDSSTMISEAICARFPVIGVSPAHYGFKPEEADYRQFMQSSRWCRYLEISKLTINAFDDALKNIHPLQTNHLDVLAGRLKASLPGLFQR